MRQLFVAALLVLAAACTSSQYDATPPTGSTPTRDQVVAQFEAIFFGPDVAVQGGGVTKWQQPRLRIADFVVVLRPDPRLWAEVQVQLETISEFSGVRFEKTGLNSAQLIVSSDVSRQFGQTLAALNRNRPKTSSYTPPPLCISTFGVSASGAIESAYVALSDDLLSDDESGRCIRRELVRAMGLLGNACHYRPSLFCKDDEVHDLAGADAVLLRTLYDPRLKPGMSREEAMPVAREIIRELWVD